MTFKKKATIFVLVYTLIGIIGLCFSCDIFHSMSRGIKEHALPIGCTSELMLTEGALLDDTVIMICQDKGNIFYRYAIAQNPSCRTEEEGTVRLTLSKRSSRLRRSRNGDVLNMSIVLQNDESIPVISDSLGSNFRIRIREAADGTTLLYARLIFNGKMPQNYVLRVNDQEIVLN